MAGQFAVRSLSVGTFEEPGYAVFWMAGEPAWVSLRLQLILIEGDGIRALVNTALPDDLSGLRAEYPSMMWGPDGAKGAIVRSPAELQEAALASAGVTPADITHVILTPIVRYTTETLDAFPNATIAMSKAGWIRYHTTHRHPHDSRRAFSEEDLVHLVTDWWPRVRLLEDEDELAPGLRTWQCGVHHRSTLVVEVDTPGRGRRDQRRLVRVRERRGRELAAARAQRELRGDVPDQRPRPAHGRPSRAAVRPPGVRALPGRGHLSRAGGGMRPAGSRVSATRLLVRGGSRPDLATRGESHRVAAFQLLRGRNGVARRRFAATTLLTRRNARE